MGIKLKDKLWVWWYRFPPRLWVRNIIRGIENLIYWFPVIWNDHNWDYYTIYTLLIHKLERMESAIRYHGWALHREDTADEINWALVGLTLLRDNYYEEEAYSFHRLKWGPLTTWTEPIDEHYSVMHFERENATTPEEKEQEGRELTRRLENAGKMHKDLRRRTFEHIAENIENWWD